MPPEPDPEPLLDEARWLERVARGLVGDEHDARDLVQEAWLAAEVGAPRIRGARRAWLVGTVRKLAAKAFRTRVRAERRIAALRCEEAAPSPAELTARAEQHERLLAHLRALPEHERIPLLMRYYEDLPPRRIAERLGTPVRTVHTRLARALAALRARLDAEHPRGRAGWLGALLLIPPPRLSASPRSAPPPVTATSGVGFRTSAWLAATLVVAAPFVLWWWTPRETSVAVDPRAESTERAGLAILPAPARSAAGPEVRSEANPWSGTVLDWHGRPIADARVLLAEHRGLRWNVGTGDDVELVSGPRTGLAAPTGPDGTFHGPTPGSTTEIRAEAPGYLTALVGIWRPERPSVPTVVLAPARSLTGRVLGADGTALASARVTVRLPAGTDARSQIEGADLHALHWNANTDAGGAFAMTAIPAVAEAMLEVTHLGHHALQVRVAECDPERITLKRWEHTTTGVLVDARGAALADAVIATSSHFATTREDGSFVLQAAPGEALRAAARGYAPCALPPAGTTPRPVLVEPMHALEGTLLSKDGAPVPGFEVSLLDATVVGDAGDVRVLESVAAGASTFTPFTETDSHGRFRLVGLADREYRLRVQDPRTAAWFATEPSSPGAHHRIVVPDDLWVARMRFRLVTTNGMPLVGASVAVQSAALEATAPGTERGPLVFAAGTSGSTDATGCVELESLPRRGAWLRIAHRDVGVVQRTFDPAAAPVETFTLTRIGRLGVRLAAARGDEWIEVLDGEGRALELACVTGISRRPETRWALAAGASPILEVPETARWLCIRTPGGGLARHPVTIVPGRRIDLDL